MKQFLARQQTSRRFLIALAALFLLVTLLEAGHAHGLFIEIQDDCALCHHAVSVDKTLIAALVFWILFAFSAKKVFFVSTHYSAKFSPFFLSRAPPRQ